MKSQEAVLLSAESKNYRYDAGLPFIEQFETQFFSDHFGENDAASLSVT